MARKGENITQRKDGRWEARYIKQYENGRAIYGYLYGYSYEEVLQKKKEMQSIIALSYEQSEVPFSLIIDAYLRQKHYQVKESTYAHYKYLIDTHIRPYFDKYKSSEITSMMLEKYVYSELSQGKLCGDGGMSPKSVKDILSLLKSIIRYGVEKDFLSEKAIMNIKAPKVSKKAIEVLSEEERILLEAHVIAANNMYFGIYLCLYTGLRIGEICALTWADIDEINACISINKTVLRIPNVESGVAKTKLIMDAPKTESSIRLIPLSPKLAQMISERKPADVSENSYFLTGTDKFIEPRNYYERYKNLLIECGIEHHSFHALRHSFATRCIEKGFDAKVLSEILGHADVKITLDRYVHPSLERKRQCMELLS